MIVLDFDQLYKTRQYHEQPAVISIGVYDGLHVGHQLIIRTATEYACKHNNWKSVVLTFAQNPKTMMGRNPYNKPLMSLRQSTDFFSKLGVDFLVMIDFSPDFSKLTGEMFIARCCCLFDVKAVVVGENFRCGSKAQTGPQELQKIVPLYTEGASVIVPPMYRISDGTEDSSTLVRLRLMQGNVSEVSELLGRHYSVDLAPLPSRNNEYPLQFSIGSFVQLLPPPGLYETLLIGSDRLEKKMITTIDEEFLTLTPLSYPTISDIHNNIAVPDRFDSLEFLKELSPLC